MNSFEVKRVDLWDGGDRHNFGFYISATVPNDQIEKTHPHCSIHKQVLTIFDDLAEVEENSYKNLRKKALAKLTPMERDALGLKE